MAQQGIRVHIYGDYNDKDIRRAVKDLQGLQTTSQTVGQKMSAVANQMQGIGQKISKVGKGLTLGVTLPIVGVGTAATTMAMEFETSMSKIIGLVGIAEDEVKAMESSVLALAGQTAKAPRELADGLFVLTSAGLRGQDALDALEFSAKAGAAGLGEVNDIARAVAGAMNAYGTEVVDAASATDVIVATARAGNFETSQFAGALGRVLPFAVQAGASLEDLGGAVALLTRTNGDAAQSITQVQALFRAFVVPTEEAKKALADVGLSAGDMRRAIAEDGLPAALQMLDEALGGNREQLGRLLGSSEAASAAFQILDADAQAIVGTFGVVNEAAGLTNDAFNTVTDTSAFKLQQALAGIKTTLIEFGLIIAPVVTQVVEKITELAQKFSELSPGTQQFIIVAGAIAAAIGPVLLIIGKIVIAVAAFIKGIALIGGAFTPIGAIIAGVVIAVGAFVGAIILAWKHSEPFRNAVANLWNALKQLASTIMGAVNSAINSFTGGTEGLGGILRTIGEIVGKVLTVAINIMIKAIKGVQPIIAAVSKGFEIAGTIFRMVANLIKGIFAAAIDILMNKLGPVSDFIQMVAKRTQHAFKVVVGAVKVAFQAAAGAVESIINIVIKAINGLIKGYNALAKVLPGVSTMSEIAEFRFNQATGAAEGFANSAYASAAPIGQFGVQANNAGTAAKQLGDGAKDTAKAVDELAKKVGGSTGATNANAEANEKAAKALEKYKTKFNETAEALKAKTKEIQQSYDNVIKSVQDVVMGAFDVSNIDPNRIGENGEKVGGTWLDGLASQAEKAVAFANKVAEVIKLGLEPGSAAFDTVMAVTRQQGTGLLDELIKGGVDKVNESIAIVDSVKNAAIGVGTNAADQFYGTGLKLAIRTEDAFQKRFGEGGPGWGKLNRLMSHLAGSLNRTSYIDVVTRYRNEGSPGTGTLAVGATGGIVNRPTFALIGEAGPEAVIPLSRTPGNEPLPMIKRNGNGNGATTNITFTVNAGIGTDGAEVGRQIVDALKQYERRNGAVYVAA